LTLVDTGTKKFQFDQIVKNYHTYKPSTDIVGRTINWLVKCNGRVIGAIGVGSSVMAMKPRDDFIGWNKEQRLKNLVKTATNWRYCLIDKTKYSSKILSLFAKEAQIEWRKKFGNKLVLLETLVEPPYTGTSYKASGWVQVGMTKGQQFKWKKKTEILSTDKVVQKWMKFDKNIDYNTWKVHVGSNTPKYIFVKPLHRYWKRELCSLKPNIGEENELKDKQIESKLQEITRGMSSYV
jgi:hypothetical protein